MYLVFIHMPGESYCRQHRSLLLYLCYVFRALINSLVCWFYKVKGMKICSVIRFDACCVRGQRGSEQPLHMVARLLQKTGLPITSAICHYQKAWGTYHCLARQESQFKSTSWVWKIITIRKFPSCVSSWYMCILYQLSLLTLLLLCNNISLLLCYCYVITRHYYILCTQQQYKTCHCYVIASTSLLHTYKTGTKVPAHAPTYTCACRVLEG